MMIGKSLEKGETTNLGTLSIQIDDGIDVGSDVETRGSHVGPVKLSRDSENTLVKDMLILIQCNFEASFKTAHPKMQSAVCRAPTHADS